jgi:hypothetical protein
MLNENNIAPPSGALTDRARMAETKKETVPLSCLADEACLLGLIPAKDAVMVGLYDLIGEEEEARNVLNNTLSTGRAAELALDTIASLFDPEDVVEIRAIDPAGGGSSSYCASLSKPAGRAALLNFIQNHNGRRNLYFGANPRAKELDMTDRAASAKNVTVRRAVFLDLDTKDAPPNDTGWTRTLVELTNMAPAFVLDSGNGHHVWFTIGEQWEVELQASVGTLRDAMARIGADNMADLPRVARLPYTVNLPNAAKRGRGAKPKFARPLPLKLPAGPAQPIDMFCRALTELASRLGLPGRGLSTTAPTSGAKAEEKKGWPAPNGHLLRMALDELPNNMGGPFDCRADWMEVCHAVKGAAAGCAADGREAWLSWCERWQGDPEQDADAWDTLKNTRTGWGTLMRTLEQHNPAGRVRVKEAELKVSFGTSAAVNSAAIVGVTLSPATLCVPASIPPRRWLYGHNLVGGYLSMLVAPGGTGKSALAMTEAVAMSSGKELMPGDKPHHGLRVWYHNAEDSIDEQQRRLYAALKHHILTEAELGGRLFLSSGRCMPLKLAQQGREGPEICPGVVDFLVEQMKAERIDVLILDPLAALHTLSENSNEAANLLMGALREVAERTGAAIMLVHHTGKAAAMDMAGAGAGAARGASAFVDGARSVRQLAAMTATEAGKLGVHPDERRKYVRIDNGKANLAPLGNVQWLRLRGVSLNNGTLEYPNGDTVQTVERWTPPAAAAAINSADTALVHAAVAVAEQENRRESHLSPGWIGYCIAIALALPIDPTGTKADARTPEQLIARETVKQIISAGLLSGWLYQTGNKDSNGKDRGFIEASEVGPPTADDGAASSAI